MKEIRIHGRGGQGSVVMAELIAKAAFEGGKYSLSFPFIGSGERRGAPVQSYVRISDEPVRVREKIESPDYIILQDDSIIGIVDVFNGLKPNGTVLINSEKSSDEFRKIINGENIKIYTIDANKISIETIGKPIVNSSLLGAFAAITGEIPIDAVVKVVKEKFSGEIGEKNANAVINAFKACGGDIK